jgi:uncharacterized membrane protein YfcA
MFPALTGLGGITEIAANIACTIGLWPGSASSVLPARGEIARLPRGVVIAYVAICLAGGAIGSYLLLHTSAAAFSRAIPWLLAFATGVFAMGKRIARWAGRGSAGQGNARRGASASGATEPATTAGAIDADAVARGAIVPAGIVSMERGAGEPGPVDPAGHSAGWTIFVGFVQFIVAIYGGYFGAGIGVLTLAGLSFTGLGDLKRINSLKVLLSTATNLSALVVFLFGPVPWRFAGPMAAASAVGGFVGMQGANRLPQPVLRGMILTIALGLTAAYFWKVYGPG